MPPALFVAVMALQLKYFNPLNEREEMVTQYSIQVGDDNVYNGNIDEQDTLTLFEKLKKYIGIFTEFCWRFLEIYMDKIIMIIAFVLVIQQVSSTHVITLFILLCPIVALRAKHLWYPLLTLYIATLIMLKMIYQVRMVEPDSFDLADDCPVCVVVHAFMCCSTHVVSIVCCMYCSTHAVYIVVHVVCMYKCYMYCSKYIL